MISHRFAVLHSILGATALAACSGSPDPAEPTGTTASAVMLPADPNWAFGLAPDAITIGIDDNGMQLYPCRAAVGTAILPGKTRGDWTFCDVGNGGREQVVYVYQTLVPAWTPASNGAVPSTATPYGHENGTPLYVCRAYEDRSGSVQVGKVRSGIGGCAYGFGGAEILATSYDVMTNWWSFGVSALPWTFGLKSLPYGAIQMGSDANGMPLYSCLVNYAGGLHPGKTRADWGGCDISYGGHEVFVNDAYQVLVAGLAATPLNSSTFPYYPGTDANGMALGICTANYGWGVQVGKYLQSGLCNFGYGGREVSVASGFSVFANYVDTTPVLQVTAYGGRTEFSANPSSDSVAFDAAQLNLAPWVPFDAGPDISYRDYSPASSIATQKEVVIAARDQNEYRSSLEAIGPGDRTTCSVDFASWINATIGPNEPPHLIRPATTGVSLANAVGASFPVSASHQIDVVPTVDQFTGSASTPFAGLPAGSNGRVNGLYVIQHGLCSTEVDIQSGILAPIEQQLPQSVIDGINQATPTGIAQATPSLGTLNMASFLERQPDGTPGGGFVQELDMVIPWAWPPAATRAFVTRNFTYRFGLDNGILSVRPSVNAQASCDTGFESGKVADGLTSAVPKGVAGSILLGALSKQAQPIPLGPLATPSPACSGNGPLPALCFQSCSLPSPDPSQWPKAPSTDNPDDPAWYDPSFCGQVAHTILDTGVGIGAAKVGLADQTSALVQNLTGLRSDDPSKMANVRCNFQPSYVQKNAAGQPQPVCEFVVRAKRVNVMPDKVEMVWFDGTSLFNPTSPSGVLKGEDMNEALSVYVMALAQNKQGSLCTRQPTPSPGVAIHPFAHVGSE